IESYLNRSQLALCNEISTSLPNSKPIEGDRYLHHHYTSLYDQTSMTRRFTTGFLPSSPSTCQLRIFPRTLAWPPSSGAPPAPMTLLALVCPFSFMKRVAHVSL